MSTKPLSVSSASRTRFYIARVITTVVFAVLVGAVWAPAASAEPPPPTTEPPVNFGLHQSWDQSSFSFRPINAVSGDEFTVTFDGKACAVRTGHRPSAVQGCSIFNTGNVGGTAVLARNRAGVGTKILDTIEIAPLAPGECGANNHCPNIQVTQYPDELRFVWNGPSGSSRTGTTISLGDKGCTVRHSKAPEAPQHDLHNRCRRTGPMRRGRPVRPHSRQKDQQRSHAVRQEGRTGRGSARGPTKETGPQSPQARKEPRRQDRQGRGAVRHPLLGSPCDSSR